MLMLLAMAHLQLISKKPMTFPELTIMDIAWAWYLSRHFVKVFLIKMLAVSLF
ncbi:hypothetical protein SAMN05216464_105304 [Mucilaginibacter pineti]|uniref:Uncharacterized protein n=1 Tax=Mucilaginibacter pineti TaxID=1391627 RepID=A0A1G7C7X7_9SPHI|nr:hypothetical protein SAMN05216464_105304 [Mucilaginibacter pineti]